MGSYYKDSSGYYHNFNGQHAAGNCVCGQNTNSERQRKQSETHNKCGFSPHTCSWSYSYKGITAHAVCVQCNAMWLQSSASAFGSLGHTCNMCVPSWCRREEPSRTTQLCSCMSSHRMLQLYLSFFPCFAHNQRAKPGVFQRQRTQSCCKHTQQANERCFHTDTEKKSKLYAHNLTICRSRHTLGLSLGILSTEISVQLSVTTASKHSLLLTTTIPINIKMTTVLAIARGARAGSEAFSKPPGEAPGAASEGLIVKQLLICFCKCAHEKKTPNRRSFGDNAGYLPAVVLQWDA